MTLLFELGAAVADARLLAERVEMLSRNGSTPHRH
jgi:hypothetical protein